MINGIEFASEKDEIPETKTEPKTKIKIEIKTEIETDKSKTKVETEMEVVPEVSQRREGSTPEKEVAQTLTLREIKNIMSSKKKVAHDRFLGTPEKCDGTCPTKVEYCP